LCPGVGADDLGVGADDLGVSADDLGVSAGLGVSADDLESAATTWRSAAGRELRVPLRPGADLGA